MNEPSNSTVPLRLVNRRLWYTLLLAASMSLLLFLAVSEARVSTQGAMGGPELDLGPSAPQMALQEHQDLGDAPDSDFNHHPGATNTAYFFAIPVAGHFPTVWDGTPPTEPSGPRHADTSHFWLGPEVSHEGEADIGPDADGINNILVNAAGAVLDTADNDAADDGWLNPHAALPDCGDAILKVYVSRSAMSEYEGPLFLNAWFDGNRDGDWADDGRCEPEGTSFEWIVQNFAVDSHMVPPGGFVVIDVPTALVMNLNPDAPAWVRFTLSERPAPIKPNSDWPDGRGPSFDEQYGLGETEDYIVEGGVPGEIFIEKVPSARGAVVGQVYRYTILLSHPQGAAPAEVGMLDELPPEVELVAGPWMTEVVPIVDHPPAFFDSSIGPSGAVGWHGLLFPGAVAEIAYEVVVRHCPPEQVIHNVAVARLPDGQEIKAPADVTVDCQPPPAPGITLQKVIPRPDDEPTDEWHVLPGQEVMFHLILNSNDALTHEVHIDDPLPPGLIAVAAGASSGVVHIVDSGHAVVWDGELGPGNRPVTIEIVARLTDEVGCHELIQNQAFWHTYHAEGESNVVKVGLVCNDLGDAPDSTNHFAATTMTAYPGIPAEFPTVFEMVAPEQGPMHLHPPPLHLGRLVSPEFEADVGFDADGPNNIVPPADDANLDRADDGLELDKMSLAHCEPARFPVWVSIAPDIVPVLLQETDGLAFLNVWLDGDRNGTWADVHQCHDVPAPEHIVIDHVLNVAALGPGLHRIWVSTTGPVFWDPPARAWLRVTLSERPSNKTFDSGAYGDGRGYREPFVWGETEDYILHQPDDLKPDPVVEKHAFLHPVAEFEGDEWREAWAVEWVADYANVGAADASNVQVVDTFDTGGVPLLAPPHVEAFPPVTPTISGNQLTFDVGTLPPSAGGHIFIHATLPISTAPGTVLTNTVRIYADDDVNTANNTSSVTVTIPFLPPVITSPRPGTTCTGTFTVTGRVQVVPTPASMDIKVYVDGTLHETVHPDSDGGWASKVTGLSDGAHKIWAEASYLGMTSAPSPVVEVIVDSTLPWSPVSLHFIDVTEAPAYTHVVLPRGPDGRMDEAGWRVFLRPGGTYEVWVYLCCTDPSAQVTLQLDGITVWLTAAGDGWYSATFTTPEPMVESLRLCVTCYQIERCSEGEVLIDPEGTVYDADQLPLAGTEVTCYEEQSDGNSGSFFSMWPAEEYAQVNPQTTGANGYYSFFTPAGTYRVRATATGYQSHVSPDLVVVDVPVHYDIYLTPVITEAADYVITVGPLGFDPPVLSAFVGAVIKWVNVDSEMHGSTSVTPTLPSADVMLSSFTSADAWHSGLIASGESYKVRLDTPGTYTYQDGDNGATTGQIILVARVYLPIVIRSPR